MVQQMYKALTHIRSAEAKNRKSAIMESALENPDFREAVLLSLDWRRSFFAEVPPFETLETRLPEKSGPKWFP
jgi:hypothetical protein